MEEAISNPTVVLASADSTIGDYICAAVASLHLGMQVCVEAAAVASVWQEAAVVIVGVDLAAEIAALGLPSRAHTYLVGGDPATVLTWSSALRAAVIVIPDQAAIIADLIDSAVRPAVSARIVAVSSPVGGAGASTLAASLSYQLARAGRSVVLVELVESAGGVDLLFAAEDLPGLRWGDLRSVTGKPSDLLRQLPTVSGVTLLSNSRLGPDSAGDRQSISRQGAEVESSVLTALAREADYLICDGIPSRMNPDQVLWVIPADVRSVAAACNHFGVDPRRRANGACVVRTGRGRRLPPRLVAETCRVPLAGVLPDEREIPSWAALGRPAVARNPLGASLSRYTRTIRQLARQMEA